MDQEHLSTTRFNSLGLSAELLRGIQEAGYEYCTPIQSETLPKALLGKDVAGQAQTGTGKTAAFLVATFHYLLNHPAAATRTVNQPRALILAPTRELAVQIHQEAEMLGKYTGLRHVVVYGGTGYEQQRKDLEEGVDILIATPGRLIDYFKQHIFNLKAIQVVVIDEADRMFDLGFIADIRYLLRRMPPAEDRLNMLFSATLSYRVTELAYEHMNQPEMITVESEQVTADNVTQVVYYTANNEKIPLLIGLLQHIKPQRTLLFVNTKRTAERVAAYLEGNDIHAAVLSGDVPQKKRLSLLRDFQSGELPILVATDIAARGLHVPEVSHVINFDLPQDAEDYVHRIGRTARAGARGDAISFACEDYAYHLPEIEAYIGQKIPNESNAEEIMVKPKPPVKIQSLAPRKRGHAGSGQRDSRNRKPQARKGRSR